MKKHPAGLLVTLLLVAAIISGASLLASCALPYQWVGGYQPSSFESNGERIYFTARSSSGQPITSSGGARMMRGGTTCVNCHGPEGKGGRVSMMMWSFNTPDITWDNLTEAKGHGEETGEDEHEEHPPYTEETLKKAITKGINPAGEPLDDIMPRWRISEADLNDLVAFIKTLD